MKPILNPKILVRNQFTLSTAVVLLAVVSLLATSHAALGAQPILYVDACYEGPEDGTQEQPYHSVGTAQAQAPAGARIVLRAGIYSESLTLAKSLEIVAGSQTATIGAPDRAVVPPADPTPPTLEVRVNIVSSMGAETLTLTPGGPDIQRSLPVNAQIYMSACAGDAQGVKSVEIFGEGITQCNGDGVSQTKFAHYSSPSYENPNVGVGDLASTRRSTRLENRAPSMCDPGFNFGSESVRLSARAENFHGGTVTTAALAFSRQ